MGRGIAQVCGVGAWNSPGLWSGCGIAQVCGVGRGVGLWAVAWGYGLWRDV